MIRPKCHRSELGWEVVAFALGAVLLAGCSPNAPSTSASASGVPAATQGPQDTEACRAVAADLASARTPLDAMRTEAVLLPFVDLIELSTRQSAQSATSASDPAVVGAMRELVAAIDDLDAQGKSRLASGADLAKTPVRLDPDRLAKALDGVEHACAVHLPR